MNNDDDDDDRWPTRVLLLGLTNDARGAGRSMHDAGRPAGGGRTTRVWQARGQCADDHQNGRRDEDAKTNKIWEEAWQMVGGGVTGGNTTTSRCEATMKGRRQDNETTTTMNVTTIGATSTLRWWQSFNDGNERNKISGDARAVSAATTTATKRQKISSN
jgi:hypothetical protein